MKRNDLTYNFICFSELVYEWDFSDKLDVENRIKKRIKSLKNEIYDQSKIEYIRELRNELFKEISLRSKSKYFIITNSHYADLEDFDIEKMKADYQERYNKLNLEDLFKILNFAVYVFYMR
jgi:hypothetical protein